MGKYVHGYSETEASRLEDQANTLVELLHPAVAFPAGSLILEAGCGVGAQTIHLAEKNPGSHLVSFDISPNSLEKARERLNCDGLSNVSFVNADLFDLPYSAETFDHIFVCFFLEHLQDPSAALTSLRGVLKEGGSITVIEGDHGSYYCHPKSRAADLAVQCLVDIQARKHGNALIGRALYPLLTGAGFRSVTVSPRMVYVDGSRPELIDGFTKKTFIAMIEGVRAEALSMGLIDEALWDKGIEGLNRSALEDGTFCYTFFRGVAIK